MAPIARLISSISMNVMPMNAMPMNPTPINPPVPLPDLAPALLATPLTITDPQELHLFYLDIGQLGDTHYGEAIQIMSTSERARADKFMRGKETYIASRWLLRRVLGHYLELAPEAVTFARTDKGKPYLPGHDLQFSLSHSGDLVVLALGRAPLIGVDIEASGGARELTAIAERYFHPHEFALLQALDDEDKPGYFYRLWTLKEAFFKALGTGISTGLEKIAFSFEGGSISGSLHPSLADNTATRAGSWHFHQWSVATRGYCALACHSESAPRIRWFAAPGLPAFP